MFFNVDVDTRASDLLRSVLEGICFHMRWLLEATEKTFPTGTIRFSGGGSLSPVMCQIMADVTGRTIETVENTRLVGAMGAAALMAVSFGMLDDIREIKDIIQVDTVYTPDPANTAVYDKIFPVFKQLYKNNKKAYAALNG